MLLIHLETTTAQEICDGVVAMGETLFSCYLYGEIIARRHRPAFFVTSNTRCTQGYYKFDDFLPSHTPPPQTPSGAADPSRDEVRGS